MIKFDYKIIRDEGDVRRTYTPSIQKELQDLICIEGPNSSGKSTLLHILALGLFGLKNRNIKDSLLKKLEDLSGCGHQKLTFYFSISNKKNNLLITSQKKNPSSPDLEVFETINGKRSVLTHESFERKYNLIYDIPNDPLKRLEELTRELKERQVFVGHRVQTLQYYIRDIIKEVQSSRDPKKLEELREQSKSLSNTINKLTVEKSGYENDLIALKRYYYSKCCLDYQSQLDSVRAKVESLREKARDYERSKRALKKKEKTLTKEASALMESIRTERAEIIHSLKQLKLKTKDDFIKIWEDLPLETIFIDPSYHRYIFEGVNTFRSKLLEYDRELQKDYKLDEGTFLEGLINFLRPYSNFKTVLPEINKTIPEFIFVLEKKYSECKDTKTLHDRYTKLLKDLTNLETNSRLFINKYLPELIEVLKAKENEKIDNFDDAQAELDRLNENYNRIQKRITYFREEAVRSGISETEFGYIVNEFANNKYFKIFASYDEAQFDDKILDLEQAIENKNHQLKENTHHRVRIEHEIERLGKKEPHKYQKRATELDGLLKLVQILEQRLLVEFDTNLKQLMRGDLKKSVLTKNQEKYFNAVSLYLGQRVGSIRHIDKEYQLKKIDLVERIIFTDSGKEIRLTDLGTGQSQSAYLKGLLHSNDKRKVIALIDEVAMMDSRSMKPVFDQLRKKYNDGSLLLGIVVQRGENLIVTEIN